MTDEAVLMNSSILNPV